MAGTVKKQNPFIRVVWADPITQDPKSIAGTADELEIFLRQTDTLIERVKAQRSAVASMLARVGVEVERVDPEEFPAMLRKQAD